MGTLAVSGLSIHSLVELCVVIIVVPVIVT